VKRDASALIDSVFRMAHHCREMKAAPAGRNGRAKASRVKTPRLRMTRRLAEKRAVGDAKAPKFDGVVFLRSLKK